jgi:flagella basal body P-ring formation protein FlgA
MSTKPRRALFVVYLAVSAILALLLGPGVASASPVLLRSDIVAPGGRLTLGDIFDDAGDASDVLVAEGGQQGGSLIIGAREVQTIAAAHGLEWANAGRYSRLIAQVSAGPAVRSRRARIEQVLTYGRNLAAGEIVEAEDIVWTPLTGVAAPIDAPRDARVIIGKAARRPLRAGAPVSQSDVSTPPVIRKDEMVSVAFSAEGIKLVLQGKALSGAAMGEVVDILNPASKKIIQAVAVGPDQAIVGPEAEQLKSAGQANPKLFASLN